VRLNSIVNVDKLFITVKNASIFVHVYFCAITSRGITKVICNTILL